MGRRWSASLRHPVALSSRYSVVFDKRQVPGKAGFSLVSEDSNVQHIRGQYCELDFAHRANLYSVAEFDVSPSEVEQKISEFREVFPRAVEFWVLLDALAFFLFLKTHARTVLNVEVPEYSIKKKDGDQPAVTDYVVVHVMHTVNISPSLIGRPIPDVAPGLGYSFFGKDRVESKDSVYGILEMPLWIDGQLSLIVEMCLMIKS